MKTRCVPRIITLSLALAGILTLLILSHGYGAEWSGPPPGQPVQIRSPVKYDRKLSDPFFESEEWTRLKHTAKCFTSFQYDRFINFCDARLVVGDIIELFIHETAVSPTDHLRIFVQNGVFWSQFWYIYKDRISTTGGVSWTTTKQELTLDKRVYRKGDVIKGRIDFECLQELTYSPLIEKYGRNPRSIKIEGVFKTILE